MKSRKDISKEHSGKLSDYYEFIHQVDLEPIKLKKKTKERTNRSLKRKLSRTLSTRNIENKSTRRKRSVKKK